jgi:hypothetical protein
MCAAALVVLVAAHTGVRLASAQESSPSEESLRIAVSFGPEQVWHPGPEALRALFGCRPLTFTCVRQIMEQDGASPDAIAFYGLTGWFLSDITDTSPVQLGTIFTPWRANENSQVALLGGVPSVVYLERETPTHAAEASQDFLALKTAHPNAIFWGSSPTLEGLDTSPQGGQRFVFGYRVLDGCHACAILGYIRVAFDFAADGTYESAEVLTGP